VRLRQSADSPLLDITNHRLLQIDLALERNLGESYFDLDLAKMHLGVLALIHAGLTCAQGGYGVPNWPELMEVRKNWRVRAGPLLRVPCRSALL
jgi:hypothetical protein